MMQKINTMEVTSQITWGAASFHGKFGTLSTLGMLSTAGTLDTAGTQDSTYTW